MLTPPPCVRGFIDCASGDTFVSSHRPLPTGEASSSAYSFSTASSSSLSPFAAQLLTERGLLRTSSASSARRSLPSSQSSSAAALRMRTTVQASSAIIDGGRSSVDGMATADTDTANDSSAQQDDRSSLPVTGVELAYVSPSAQYDDAQLTHVAASQSDGSVRMQSGMGLGLTLGVLIILVIALRIVRRRQIKV